MNGGVDHELREGIRVYTLMVVGVGVSVSVSVGTEAAIKKYDNMAPRHSSASLYSVSFSCSADIARCLCPCAPL